MTLVTVELTVAAQLCYVEQAITTHQVVGFHQNDRLMPTIQTEKDTWVSCVHCRSSVAVVFDFLKLFKDGWVLQME